jgi:hypothetical protein
MPGPRRNATKQYMAQESGVVKASTFIFSTTTTEQSVSVAIRTDTHGFMDGGGGCA